MKDDTLKEKKGVGENRKKERKKNIKSDTLKEKKGVGKKKEIKERNTERK